MASPMFMASRRNFDPPRTIGGCYGWWRASDLTDRGLTDGALVSMWPDQSGQTVDVYDYNLYQATGANQPIFKTNVLNGFPAVRFTGTQWMISALPIGTQQIQSICVLAATAAGGASGKTLTASSVNGGPQCRMTDYKPELIKQNVVSIGTSPTALSVGTFYRFEFAINCNADQWEIRVGDATAASGTTTANFDGAGCFALGRHASAVDYFYGDIVEVISFHGKTLTAADRTALSAYWRGRYGIA